ncbi:MAG: GTP pyrophosphokinase [Bacilli bacterium]|nr:GTP pyrophosphokinase [Bacilli bacterium]
MLEKYFTEEEYKKVKETNELIYKSLEIVTRVFSDKTDKGGFPYVIHLLKVYSGVSEYIEKVCALLHDIIEDTDVSYDDLRKVGYSEEIIDILTILTKLKGEDHRDYINRIISSNNYHAMNIKLADLRHNMDSGRIKNPTPNDYERITKRYEPAYEKISNKLNERGK